MKQVYKLCQKWLNYFFQICPIRLNAILLILIFYLGYHYLYLEIQLKSKDESAAFYSFVLLLIKAILYLFSGVFLLSISTTFISWLVFLLKYRHRKDAFSIIENGEHHPTIVTKINLFAIPFLGFVRCSLLDKKKIIISRINIVESLLFKVFWRKQEPINLPLIFPNIQVYHIDEGLIFFEDMLGLFSFPIYKQLALQCVQLPHVFSIEHHSFSPTQTKDTTTSINKLKRVEGDFLNYKNFESSDDVRRIVWKIYAKNKDLVVRTPEHFEPFADEVFFYASFYKSSAFTLMNLFFSTEMLNYYKNSVYSIFNSLLNEAQGIKLITEISGTNEQNQLRQPLHVAQYLAHQNWQDKVSLKDYCSSKSSILCISSMMEINELKQFLADNSEPQLVYFVRCSSIFQQSVAINLLRRIFFFPTENQIHQSKKLNWYFSPSKIKIKRNEKKLITILEESKIPIIYV